MRWSFLCGSFRLPATATNLSSLGQRVSGIDMLMSDKFLDTKLGFKKGTRSALSFGGDYKACFAVPRCMFA